MNIAGAAAWSTWPVLRSCTPAWVRGFVLLATLLLLALATKAATADAAILGNILCAIAVVMAWMLWFAKLLLLHLEARQAQVPGLARAVGHGVLQAWIVSVLLPAAVLAWAGIAFVTAVSTLSVAAFGGLLFFLLPRALLLFFSLLPALWLLVKAWVLTLPVASAGGWTWRVEYWPWLAMGMGLLAAGGWWHCLHWVETGSRSAWKQPLLLMQAEQLNDKTAPAASLLDLWRLQACLQDAQVHAGPETPLQAMRHLLGGSHAPWGRRQKMLYALGLFGVCLLITIAGDQAFANGLLGGVLIAGNIGALLCSQRLEQLYQHTSRELDELALLPGLGGARQVRRRWLGIALWPAVRMLLLTGLLSLLLTQVRVTLTAAEWGQLVVLLVDAAILAVLGCMRPLAGLSSQGLRGLFLTPGIVACVLAALGLVYHVAVRSEVLLGVLLLLGLFYAGMACTAWRKYQMRPHPFLPMTRTQG